MRRSLADLASIGLGSAIQMKRYAGAAPDNQYLTFNTGAGAWDYKPANSRNWNIVREFCSCTTQANCEHWPIEGPEASRPVNGLTQEPIVKQILFISLAFLVRGAGCNSAGLVPACGDADAGLRRRGFRPETRPSREGQGGDRG